MAAQIHPTAIIENGAQLGEDVVVGAYSLIGAKVIVGARTQIGAHNVIEGLTTIGEENQIGHHVMLGGAPQDKKYAGEATRLEIGDRNLIREFTSIHRGTIQDQSLTHVGNDNWIMGYVHLAHDCVIGDHTVLASNVQMAGHVQVGDWAIIGGMTGVHQFVKIGAHAMVGGGSGLHKDVPPYIMSSGNPNTPFGINSEGLKRRGFSPEQIMSLKRAYKAIYRQDLTIEQAIEAIQLEAAQTPDSAAALLVFSTFLASSTRGIIR